MLLNKIYYSFILTLFIGLASFQRNAQCLLESFDKTMHFIDYIEKSSLEEFDEHQLDQIFQIITSLAQRGCCSAEELLEIKSYSKMTLNHEYPPPSLSKKTIHGYDITLCKGWLSKKCEKIKRFLRRNKKKVIAGSAATIATTAAVATIAKAVKNKASKKKKKQDQQKANILLKEKLQHFKELLNANNEKQSDKVYKEKARYFGSSLAHDLFSELVEMIAIAPEVYEELKDLLKPHISDEKRQEQIDLSSKDSTENFLKKGHKIIDKAFTTNLANNY